MISQHKKHSRALPRTAPAQARANITRQEILAYLGQQRMATTVRLAAHCRVSTGSARHCLDTLLLDGLVKQLGMESEASGRQRSMLWALGDDDEVSPPLERQVRLAKEWDAGGVQRDPLVAALFGPAGATREARV